MGCFERFLAREAPLRCLYFAFLALLVLGPTQEFPPPSRAWTILPGGRRGRIMLTKDWPPFAYLLSDRL